MSDRRVFSPDRALGQQYSATMEAMRSATRRGAWPTPVQISSAPTPIANSPAPLLTYDHPNWNTVGSSLKVAELELPQGRWYVVASSSQRFTPVSGSPSAGGGQFLLIDGVVVASDYDPGPGLVGDPSQISCKSPWTFVAPPAGSLVELLIYCGYAWVMVPDPAPTQSLRTAQIVAYPG